MTMLLPVRLAFGLTKGSLVLGYRAGRLAGYRRLTVLAIGVGIGLLAAPVTGRELRARIREAWDQWSGVAPGPHTAPAPPAPGTAPAAAPTDGSSGDRAPGTGAAR
jgi:hypothetical protein